MPIEQAVISALYDCYEDSRAELTTERLVRSVREIIPLSYTMKEQIDGMRQWSRSRARRASLGEEVDEQPSIGRQLDI